LLILFNIRTFTQQVSSYHHGCRIYNSSTALLSILRAAGILEKSSPQFDYSTPCSFLLKATQMGIALPKDTTTTTSTSNCNTRMEFLQAETSVVLSAAVEGEPANCSHMTGGSLGGCESFLEQLLNDQPRREGAGEKEDAGEKVAAGEKEGAGEGGKASGEGLWSGSNRRSDDLLSFLFGEQLLIQTVPFHNSCQH
jgi:hypothetical protein